MIGGTHRTALVPVPKWAIVAAVWTWLAVVLATHYGARSPYSYVDVSGATISGLAVNHDALSVVPVTRFFYEAAGIDYAKAHNLKLPLHSALAAAALSYLRSYMLASYAVNLLALWLLACAGVTLADKFGVPRAATLVVMLTCTALPPFAHYIGQPMHYSVGLAMNSLALMAAIAMGRDGVRSPLRFGLLTAILLLGYDPYVSLIALVVWLLVVIRLRGRELIVYVITAAVPFAFWRAFVWFVSIGHPSSELQQQILVIPRGWLQILLHLREHQLVPFAAGHVGIIVALRMLLGIVYWPMLVLCVAGLLTLRRDLRSTTTTALLSIVAITFLAVQLVSAGFDGECNPRRAFAMLLVLSCAYAAVAARKIERTGWRIAFTMVMFVSMFVTLSDTLIRNPVAGYIHTPQGVIGRSKDAFDAADSFLSAELVPGLATDAAHPQWWDTRRANVTRPALFVLANVFCGAAVFALLLILRERDLVPRFTASGFALVYAGSLAARFIGS